MITLSQFLESEKKEFEDKFPNELREYSTKFGYSSDRKSELKLWLSAHDSRLLAHLREWVKENEYCSKCCSPKKFCNKWGESASAIETEDLFKFLSLN